MVWPIALVYELMGGTENQFWQRRTLSMRLLLAVSASVPELYLARAREAARQYMALTPHQKRTLQGKVWGLPLADYLAAAPANASKKTSKRRLTPRAYVSALASSWAAVATIFCP
jgi:hypothetical protein